MRLAVTGSSGQIGSYVVDAARRDGVPVTGISRRASAWTTFVGDVRSTDACAQAFADHDAVIHCAGSSSVHESVFDPLADAEQNVLGTISALEAARAAGVRRFVYVSSSAVYGPDAPLPVSEDAATLPANPYGASKLAGEHYVRLARQLHGLHTVVVRPFNVYSPRQNAEGPYAHVTARFAKLVRARRPPVVYGSGAQTRDFVHATDVAQWLLRAVEVAPSGAVLNFGSGVETSVAELARLFIKAAGLDLTPEPSVAPTGEVDRSVADTTAQRALGLIPRVSLEEGVRELVLVR